MVRSRRFRLVSNFIVAIIAIVLALGLWFPAIAQTPTKVPVVLDGEPIFQVSNSGQYSARERADAIAKQLQNVVQADRPIQVEIEQRNQLPTILLNDRYLLTVTERDAIPGSTPQEQASQWVQQIQEALERAKTERTTAYLWQTILLAAGIVLIAAALTWGLGWIKHRFFQAAQEQLTASTEADADRQPLRILEFLFKLVLAIARIGLWIGVVLYITNLFPFTRQWSYQIANVLGTSLASPVLTLSNNSYSVIDLVILAGLLFGLVIFAGIVTNLFRSRVLRYAGINRGAQEAIAILAKYGLIFVGSLVLLQIWGLDISSLAIVASALSVGIGFGLQDIAKNFGSGIVLVFERPIQVGDFVEVGEYKGTVERIGARSTEIRTLDRVSIIVPNSRFLENEVINWSHRNPISRLHLPVGVAYGCDAKAVEAALLEAARNHPKVLKSPPPQVLFKSFGDSALDFELLVWTKEPERQFLLTSDLYYQIYDVLNQREIEIPFPQHDLHLRSGTVGLSPQVESALTQMLARWHNNGDRHSHTSGDGKS
ncbi:mechanosensitive ion channel protein MscS [Chroococcidiopsis sp. CCALA 051]|uniref:mechanosensitive ion channel family protein n=1 Tax=Chroococcidiopsis sp. CCALA 051 TaxID=869949 RepID=UPI000D0E313E|nr:mechanosensitive ion channel domain-containing protein [Chroococcidiopsis sp. CCALA 051]PSM47053.1 mechanosensitive ion channel protein MscS [Chroococcidiopsis sp. CCALA 051]